MERRKIIRALLYARTGSESNIAPQFEACLNKVRKFVR